MGCYNDLDKRTHVFLTTQMHILGDDHIMEVQQVGLGSGQDQVPDLKEHYHSLACCYGYGCSLKNEHVLTANYVRG